MLVKAKESAKDFRVLELFNYFGEIEIFGRIFYFKYSGFIWSEYRSEIIFNLI